MFNNRAPRRGDGEVQNGDGSGLGVILSSSLVTSLPLLAMAGAAQGAREAFVLSC